MLTGGAAAGGGTAQGLGNCVFMGLAVQWKAGGPLNAAERLFPSAGFSFERRLRPYHSGGTRRRNFGRDWAQTDTLRGLTSIRPMPFKVSLPIIVFEPAWGYSASAIEPTVR